MHSAVYESGFFFRAKFRAVEAYIAPFVALTIFFHTTHSMVTEQLTPKSEPEISETTLKAMNP